MSHDHAQNGPEQDGHEHDHPHGAPHAPDPPAPWQLIPEREMLVRGLALAALAGGLALSGWRALRAAHGLLAPVALVLGAAALLSAWAAAIHLTGGERFDDHPLV